MLVGGDKESEIPVVVGQFGGLESRQAGVLDSLNRSLGLEIHLGRVGDSNSDGGALIVEKFAQRPSGKFARAVW